MYVHFCKHIDSEGLDLSYRDDLGAFRNDRARRKNIIGLAIKITVVLLAVLFLATTVSFIVDMRDRKSVV